MIASLRGKVVGLDSNYVIIEVGGVGFRVMLSTQNLALLGDTKSEVSILTTLIVRDDNLSLYGFKSEQEQRLFEKLMTVSSVGPKVAMSALSSFSAEDLHRLILSEDVTRIATIPGIGKKTAQRIILELRGVLDMREQEKTSTPIHVAASKQASEALLNMGFSAKEVNLALQGYEGDANSVEALIRFGLKRLGAS